MASSNTINERAQTGFSKSAAYDQHRPAYTPTVVQLLLENLRVDGKKHAKVLDLAAGTGKFTEALAAREEQYEIIAVEPHDEMRQVLVDKKLSGVTAVSGKGDSIPLDDQSVDAVICAQAFHWFANTDALREIHRVSKPHGGFGMVWNVDDYNAPMNHKATTEWEAKLHNLTWTFNDDVPRYRHEEWRKVFDGQSKATPLSLLIPKDQLFSLPLAEERESFEVRLSKEKLWERYCTLSHIANLQGEERESTYKKFMEILSTPDVEIDQHGNVVSHGHTIAVWTSNIPEEGRDGLGDTVDVS